MKVVVIGVSPYLLTSRSKVNAEILKRFYLENHQVAGLVWGHDPTYFIPEEVNGKKKFYYDFEYSGKIHKIPITPFNKGEKESINVYELLKALNPDIIVTVGDLDDFLFMRAIKIFHTGKFKWFAVLANYSYPINERNIDIINDIDGILCASEFCFETIKPFYDKNNIDFQYVGCDSTNYTLLDFDILSKEKGTTSKYRITTSGKTAQTDNLPVVMQAVAELRSDIPNIELYVHSNIYDTGDYDLNLIKDRFDPENEFIRFPDKYVSLVDGITDRELSEELNVSELFISPHMVSAMSMSIFESLSCGCFPLMTDCGSNRDVALLLEDYFNKGITKEDVLISSIEFMAEGETYLSLCDPKDLKKKILNAYKKRKIYQGFRKKFLEFTQKHEQSSFLEKAVKMAVEVSISNETICLESI